MLDATSIKRLAGVHHDLVQVATRAHEMAVAKKLDFKITEGLRTLARQKELVASGASKTMDSRHLTGHAFDFVPVVGGIITWKWPAFWPLVSIFEAAAHELGVEIRPGARWTDFPDGPHIELNRKFYP